ncbi:MAG: glycosyltransferase family A protein [Acidimicrobiales bacterium]
MDNQIAAENQQVAGRITFVVPTKNSGRTIEACLQSITNQANADVELIVVDNDSTDNTFEVASELADLAVRRGPERSAQRNHGLALATGEFVVFIDSDMVLEPGIANEAVSLLTHEPALGALVIPELAFGEGPWAPARIMEKELYIGDPAVEAARVFRSDACRSIGGYDERLNGREDWDLPDRLQLEGWGIGRVTSRIWHDEGHISLRETFSKKRYYGVGSTAGSNERATPAHRTGIAGRVRPLAKAVARNPLVGTQLVVLKTAELAGFTVGQRAGR